MPPSEKLLAGIRVSDRREAQFRSMEKLLKAIAGTEEDHGPLALQSAEGDHFRKADDTVPNRVLSGCGRCPPGTPDREHDILRRTMRPSRKLNIQRGM
jgi:hypothetical protein